MPIVATGFSCRDKDHRRALQSLLSGKLPRADRHHLGLRSRLDAVLPDGRAAARRVDEAASRRAPGGMALRAWQTGWKGSLGWKSAFLAGVRGQSDRRLFLIPIVRARPSRQANVMKSCIVRSWPARSSYLTPLSTSC